MNTVIDVLTGMPAYQPRLLAKRKVYGANIDIRKKEEKERLVRKKST